MAQYGPPYCRERQVSQWLNIACTHSQHEVNAPPPTALANRLFDVVRSKAGYGMCFVPPSPGSYDLDCVTWRPQGTLTDRLSGEITTHTKNDDTCDWSESKGAQKKIP